MPQHRKLLTCIIFLGLLWLAQPPAYGWNSTGHRMVARIAWDNLTPNAQQRMVALLMQAPNDSCLPQLFSNDSRPLSERQREFFTLAATWPDIVRRNGEDDHRPCLKYHRGDWHFVDFFWSGTSGSPTDPPHNLPNPVAQVNAEERLLIFRNLVNSNLPPSDRALALAWILHLVGDIHQPLHASGRVTSLPREREGDRGGNEFKLNQQGTFSLHSFWDNIIDRRVSRLASENDTRYVDRLSMQLEQTFPPSTFSATLNAGNIHAWVQESLRNAQVNAYPASLHRNQLPNNAYATNTFEVCSRSIAESGYRLANMLNQLFGS